MNTKIEWAARVPKEKLARLYAQESTGLLDESVVEDVGITLLLRCLDILAVEKAKAEKLVRCQQCYERGDTVYIQRSGPLDEVINCTRCGWSIVWRHFKTAAMRKQLNAGGAAGEFSRYAEHYPRARSLQEKMLLIDRLIHAFHFSMKAMPDLPTRPAGVNLIQGKLGSVLDFLDSMSAAGTNVGPLEDNRAAWEANRKKFGEIDWREVMVEVRARREKTRE